jgi:hypothetical protein
MAGHRVSRNDPCPCGSGKKFKNCCISKDIDWEARRPSGAAMLSPAPPRPRTAPHPFPLGPFEVVDARLKTLAKETPGPATWKPLVDGLSDATPEARRMAAYLALRDAGVVPPEATLFLFDHAAGWMPSNDNDLDRHIETTLRRYGLDDLADQYARDRLSYDRLRERGRQFFLGPPDEEFAVRLRAKGIID